MASAADQLMVKKIITCESGGHPHKVGDDGDSYGIAQFQRETFYRFAHQAKLEMWCKRDQWPPRWKNPKHQVFLLNWGLDHGKEKSWVCYRLITGTITLDEINKIYKAAHRKKLLAKARQKLEADRVLRASPSVATSPGDRRY